MNEHGKKIGAIIDIKTYRKMINDLDEYLSIKEYRTAKNKTEKEIARGEFVTLKEFKRKFSKKKNGK